MDVRTCDDRIALMDQGNVSEDTAPTEPMRMSLTLKQHQKTMLTKMLSLENGEETLNDGSNVCTTIGVCADMTAAGKSIEVLALIATKKAFAPTEHIDVQFGSYVHVKRKQISATCNNLIVAPHSCVSQWSSYISRFTEMSHIVIAKRKEIDSFNPIDHYETDIVLCSSSMYNEFSFTHCETIRWSRVFFDEADTINIPAARTPDTNFVWFITSSLHNLLFPSGNYFTHVTFPNSTRQMITRKYIDGIRKVGYIRNVFRSLEYRQANEIISKIVLKSNDEFVKRSFALDSPVHHVIHCRTPHYVNVLRGLVSPDIIHLLNAGNIDGAIEKTGCKVDTNDNIIASVTRSFTEKLENTKREITCAEELRFSRPAEEDARVRRLKGLQEAAEKLQFTIQSIEERIGAYNDSSCSICMDAFTTPTVVRCCQNVFCFECITRSLTTKPSCPMCRAAITKNEINVISEDHTPTSPGAGTLPNKDEALMSILRERRGGKFLIFSAHDQSFYYIERALEHEHHEAVRLMGSIARVNALLRRYKEGDLDVLMLNASHYGTGLNLENTTDLIFYHKMSSDMEKQVIGRAQRAGRTCALRVHHLYQDNEITGES